LPLVEVGGDFTDAVAIARDALLGSRGSRLLLRDFGALVGSEQLVDEHGERNRSPSEQHRAGDQRNALLPNGADTQKPDMAVRANEDFMVLEQRIETLAPMAQTRRLGRQATTPSCCSDGALRPDLVGPLPAPAEHRDSSAAESG